MNMKGSALKMKKQYLSAEIMFELLLEKDVITSSVPSDNDGDIILPEIPLI